MDAVNLLSLPAQPITSHSFRPPSYRLSFCARVQTNASTSLAITQETPRYQSENGSDGFVGSRRLSRQLNTKNPTGISRQIRRFCKQGNLGKALAVLDYAEKRGTPVSIAAFAALLIFCTKAKCLKEGKQVHVHIRINGLEENEFLCSKLVSMYAACGSMEDSKLVFSKLQTRSVFPWNNLLRGSVINGGHSKDVLGIFSHMREAGVEPNVYTFSCLLKRIAGSSALRHGKMIHAHLVKTGLFSDSIIQTVLMDMYFKCGKVYLARQLFDEMRERDIVLWGAAIAGFAHNGLRREAIDSFREMLNHGHVPNSVILTSIIPVCGDMGLIMHGKEIHCFLIKTGYFKHIFIHASLVDMYCKCDDLVLGRRVFYAFRQRNVVTWTALISGYAHNGMLDRALKSVIWMLQEGVKPDLVTVATIIPICSELKALRTGKEIHCYALKKGILPNVSIATSLIVMYSKCGVTRSSLNLFEKMEKRNAITWTAMMESLARDDRLHDALDMFRSMQLSKHRADSVTVCRGLNLCAEVRALKLGKELHAQVLKKKIESNPSVSAEIVRMYAKCGHIQTAKQVFDAIASKGLITWTTIIEAYGMNNLSMEAFALFEQMKEDGFSPNHFTYAVLIEICRNCGLREKEELFVQSLSALS
ncbi:pentatricopeptide repeat-containing protein At1g71460, chloroplastic [Nymphaea colorata]|uniref:Pentacotripeptide-repeat region of PRORP domain-containing protein n=1 Tax=Nymphaea colorata TaxID=210225 RepID=A0A5K1AYE4_9MAGN|nr:pentatricopeptide repeat-containing protein At1g71460, chloroplastic [Nymphaea colorata]